MNDIFPKLRHVQYLSLIDASLGYHTLKLDKQSPYTATSTCQFGRYIYKRLPFGAGPTGDMFQRKIDKIFKDLSNIFGIADHNLTVGYDRDCTDHDDTLQRVPQVFRQVNLKLNKDKCHFRYMQGLFFGKIISKNVVKPNPGKLKAMTEIPPPKTSKHSLA